MIVPWPCANILTQYNMYVLELGLGKTVNTVSRRQQEIDGEIRDVFLRWGFLKIITQDHACYKCRCLCPISLTGKFSTLAWKPHWTKCQRN